MILERIYETVKSRPESVALVSGGEKITYGELWEKSGILAAELDRRLGSDMTPVPVYGHKSPLMLVSFIACARTGRAYVPNDISMPAERIADICEAVGNRIVLEAGEKAGLGGYEVIDVAEVVEAAEGSDGRLTDAAAAEAAGATAGIAGDGIAEAAPPKVAGAGALAGPAPGDTFYIIFTSGSTGKPKGVEVSNAALTNFADWMGKLSGAEENPGTVFLNQAPFSFDLSVMDLYTALSTGGTVFALPKNLQEDAAAMYDALAGSGIETWVSTPSFADLCLADRKFDAALLPSLGRFIFCGEKLTKKTVRKLRDRFPCAEILNTYGPTESTVAVTSVKLTDDIIDSEKDLPIGTAKPGTEILLDDETGEILITGNTLAKGYYKDPEKTAKAFVPAEELKTGEIFYRTGDAGHLDGGLLYYDGRIDFQVKLHGYRMELGDIESNLTAIDGIDSAAVVPKKDGEGKVKHLVAFAAEGRSFAEKKAEREEIKRIKAELRKKLPSYMVPKKIVLTDALPVTANGKTDRRRLEEAAG